MGPEDETQVEGEAAAVEETPAEEATEETATAVEETEESEEVA